MSVSIPHLAFPLRLNATSLAVVEQDTIDDIAGCVEAILRTPVGYRVELPDFGIQEQALRENGPDLPGVRAAVRKWEPRADLLLDETTDPIDPRLSHVRALVQAGPEGTP